MNPLKSNCIIEWELYHIVNDTQNKFINRLKLEIERKKEKKKGIKKPKQS